MKLRATITFEYDADPDNYYCADNEQEITQIDYEVLNEDPVAFISGLITKWDCKVEPMQRYKRDLEKEGL